MDKYYEVIKFNESISPILEDISRPLIENFGIRLITYRRFYNDGKLLYLFNHKLWMEYVLKTENWISTSFQKKIKNITANNRINSVWDEIPTNSDPIYSALYEHNIWYGISIYRRYKHYIETFAFAGTKETPAIIHLYSEKEFVLDRFILYFLERANPIISNYDPNILIPFSIDSFIDPIKINKKVESFIKDTPINRFFININGADCMFSKRDMECLIKTIKGKTAKEIARELGISYRSVETYLENLKYKTGCGSRKELIKNIFLCDVMKHLLFNENGIFEK